MFLRGTLTIVGNVAGQNADVGIVGLAGLGADVCTPALCVFLMHLSMPTVAAITRHDPLNHFFPLIVKLGSVTTVVNAGFGYQRTGFSVYTSLAWTLV